MRCDTEIPQHHPQKEIHLIFHYVFDEYLYNIIIVRMNTIILLLFFLYIVHK